MKILKNFPVYIFKKLKYDQHKIKSKTDISLEITLNVCKCLIVSLVLLEFLFGSSTDFILVGILCEFAMVPLVYILLSIPEKKGSLFFLRTQMYTFSRAFIKQIQTFVWHITILRLLLSWKKQKGIQLCYGICDESK